MASVSVWIVAMSCCLFTRSAGMPLRCFSSLPASNRLPFRKLFSDEEGRNSGDAGFASGRVGALGNVLFSLLGLGEGGGKWLGGRLGFLFLAVLLLELATLTVARKPRKLSVPFMLILHMIEQRQPHNHCKLTVTA